jgi:uncharacterized protein DUF3303
MVVEQFKDVRAIYKRFHEKGRMMPEGLDYISSWINHDLKTCWQLMETEDERLFRQWTGAWNDLMDFEIIPVHSSAELIERMSRQD